MRKIALVFILIAFANLPFFAQDLRKKAEESPLDCALYLASTDSLSDNFQLAQTLFELGRFDDAVRAVQFEGGEHSRILWLIVYSAQLIKQGNLDKANRFLDKTIENIKNGGEYEQEILLIKLAESLIKLGRVDDAFSTIGFAETKFDYDEDKIAVAIGVSKAFLEKSQNENAIKALSNIYKRAEPEQKAEIIELYLKLNQREKAENIFSEFEQAAFAKENAVYFTHSILPLVKANIALGRTEKALEIWKRYGDKRNYFQHSQIIDSLIRFGEREKAYLHLNEAKSDPKTLQGSRKYVVENYLKLNDTESALDAAKSHPFRNDDLSQHLSFTVIADKLIADNRKQKALEILEYAFQRAEEVEYEISSGPVSYPTIYGSDPASRKTYYLKSIFNQYAKLEEFEKARNLINSFENQQAKAEMLVEFAKLQLKTLPRSKTHEFLVQARKTVKDDGDYGFIRINLLTAEVYAQMGEKSKALKLLKKVLEEANQFEWDKENFLLSAGKIFEQNNLKADANMRRVLRQFLKDAE